MRILFIGDVVGRPGKRACALIPKLIRERQLDAVVANAENIAGGSGITPQMFSKLLHQGVDVCTLGDHIYKRREIVPTLEQSERIVKPANLPPEAAGRACAVATARNGVSFAVISLLGRTYMNMKSECPFHAVDAVLKQLPQDLRVILVDMHAEATAEKMAMGWHLDGRVSAVLGTHTHVPTADERILPKGTAYITDVGMTGPYESILGRDTRNVLAVLITGMPYPYDVAHGDVRLCGAIVELDSTTGRAISIERVMIPVAEAAGEDGADDE